MELEPRRYADVLVVAPVGRIGHDNAEAFRVALVPQLERCRAGADQVVLDFSGLEYISSAGLRVLMLAAKQAKAQSGTLVIAGMQPVVREIFQISRFDLVFEAYESLPAALGRLSPDALAALQKA